MKIRKFEILAVEDRGLDFYVITYKGIVKKKWVVGELNITAKNETQARNKLTNLFSKHKEQYK